MNYDDLPESQRKKVWKDLQTDCRVNFPFVSEDFSGYYTVPAKLEFTNRGGKLYMKAELYNRSEMERERFKNWIKQRCLKYGMKPYMTSGGVGKYSFRLNGDLEFDWL